MNNGDWQLYVRREYVGGNPKYDFPSRPLGWARLVGVFLIGFGVLFVWMPGREAWQSLQKLFQGDTDIGNVIFGIFPLLFVVAGALPLGIGLLILFGRCRVEWRDGQLRSAEILGPFRWTRRMPHKPIRKLEVASATSKSGNSPPKQIETFAGLAAVFEDGSKKLVVMGYPKDWLLAVAQELSGYVGAIPFSASAAQVEVVEHTEEAEADDVTQQPTDSRVRVEERGNGVRLSVPPAGIWRGSKGLFFFALMWCGFMAFFTAVAGPSVLKPGRIEWAFVAFIVAFWAIGIALITGSIHMGRRSATLEADTARLCVETRGLFGTKRREWTRADLSAIRADASGMEVNDRPVIELQIHPLIGKKVGVLAGRQEDEIRWMATRLRQKLDLPARKA